MIEHVYSTEENPLNSKIHDELNLNNWMICLHFWYDAKNSKHFLLVQDRHEKMIRERNMIKILRGKDWLISNSNDGYSKIPIQGAINNGKTDEKSKSPWTMKWIWWNFSLNWWQSWGWNFIGRGDWGEKSEYHSKFMERRQHFKPEMNLDPSSSCIQEENAHDKIFRF